MANDLKWFFGPSASEKHGPNDSITTTFRGDKYYSLAREVLQNSIDAIDVKDKPVRVSFSSFDLEKTDLPIFWDLKNNFIACQKYFTNNNSFTNFCESAKNNFSEAKIKCLKIQDFNTTGLEYSGGTESKFFGFMESVGVTNKSAAGAGGSFGFGKGAYYAASSVRTIMVSSIYGNDDKFIYQGKARLTTHQDEAGNLKDYTGLLGHNNGKPIQDALLVPESLRRVEKGTDIIIVGFQNEGNWKESLIKSVINNFWYSIYSEKLIVEVEDTIINKENLERIISEYYSENTVDGSVNEPESWNPYPYFKAVKYSGDINTKYFEKELETIGLVKLYLLLKDGLPNRTVYMRSPRMTVFKKTDNRGFNYVGVFVCDNTKGNEVLQKMENPQHNEWKKNNYLENDKDPHPDAKKAENELKMFMKDCLETLMSVESGKKQKIIGLDTFLNIPEDLIAENEGNGEASGGGDVSEEKTIDESAVETTQKESENMIILDVKKKAQLLSKDLGDASGEDKTTVLTGKEHKGEGDGGDGDDGGDKAGGAKEQGGITGKDTVKRPLNIRYRVIAQKNSLNEVEHIIKIFSTKNVNAEIELYAGVDNDSESDDSMLIINNAMMDSNSLLVNQNRIKNIPIINGWNSLVVKFDTNQKHSLKIKSYEF